MTKNKRTWWFIGIVFLCLLNGFSISKYLDALDSMTAVPSIELKDKIPEGPPVRYIRRSTDESYNPSGYAPLPAFNPPFHYRLRAQKEAYVSKPEVVATMNTVYPRYNYSSNDTGNGELGNHLKCSFQSMTRPTYYQYRYPGFFKGYSPRYGHYKIHYYNHVRDLIPSNTTIESEAMVDCPEESQTICPIPTYSLCTNNGNLLCVIESESTLPCIYQNQTLKKCFNGHLPRVDDTCQNHENLNITLPCFSFFNITGRIVINNRSLLIEEATDFSFQEVINVKKRINEFCVVLLAVPAERNYTSQERIIQRTGDLLVTFFSRAHVLKTSSDGARNKINSSNYVETSVEPNETSTHKSTASTSPSPSGVISLESLGINLDSYGDLMTPILMQIDDELRKKKLTAETIELGDERYSLKALGVNVTNYPVYLRPIWNEIDYELKNVPTNRRV